MNDGGEWNGFNLEVLSEHQSILPSYYCTLARRDANLIVKW